MIREEMRDYLRKNPVDWPALNATQRMRLAVLLRPDLPVGIRNPMSNAVDGDTRQRPPEAA